MKIKIRYLLIVLFMIFVVLAMIFYKCCLYYPDIEIKVSDLNNDPPKIIQLNGEYYKVEDGNVYNLDTGVNIFHTTDKQAFAKETDGLLWIIDNSDRENLKVINSSGEIVKSYSVPNNIEDFLIDDNILYCMQSDEIKVYKLYNNGQTENIPIEYSFVYESDKCGFKMYSYSCEDITCLWFDMSDYEDAYFVVDLSRNDVIDNKCSYIQLLDFEANRIVFTPSLFQLKTLYEYSFADNLEICYDANFEDYAQGFFKNTPYFADEKYIVSVAQLTTSRSITRDGGPEAFSNEMSKHESDCLFIVNNDYCAKSFQHCTRTFERILYADSKKAITYYNGEYLTYSIEDWKVTSSQPADEIKEGGSYTFESCGDYIFVFDDNSGELLNTINVA